MAPDQGAPDPGAVLVKICGLNDPEAVAAVAAAGADYAGFVFFPASPRAVSGARAAALARGLPDRIRRVGLFVAPTEPQVAAVLAELPLDVLQLYAIGDAASAWRARFGRPVWTAHGIAAAADLPTDAAGADALLIEARAPSGATRPGGNAAVFDWALLRGWRAPAPWLLAGGLTPDNVAAAIAATGARAVDVSSGVEREIGRKDPELVYAFLTRARAAAALISRQEPAPDV
jgi:phosphoribosylanthranilate isomerase